MLYKCGCGFTTEKWGKRKEHLKMCGKPVEKKVKFEEVKPIPEEEKMGLEKWLY